MGMFRSRAGDASVEKVSAVVGACWDPTTQTNEADVVRVVQESGISRADLLGKVMPLVPRGSTGDTGSRCRGLVELLRDLAEGLK